MLNLDQPWSAACDLVPDHLEKRWICAASFAFSYALRTLSFTARLFRMRCSHSDPSKPASAAATTASCNHCGSATRFGPERSSKTRLETLESASWIGSERRM